MIQLKTCLTDEIQDFFNQVFSDQYQAAFGQVSDKSDNGNLVFTVTAGNDLLAAMSCERKYACIKIKDLAVKTDQQKRGLGSQLITHLKTYAKSHGVTKLRLTTRSYQAKDFYLKHGFTVFGELDDMPLAGVTTYFMVYQVS